ncbi:MAG: deoxyguanosinetriphosphate triphosphohydrolase [Planctomycetota bacterium]
MTPSAQPDVPPPNRGSITRHEIEAREDALLAPYAMRSQASRGRMHAEEEHAYRTVYMRDRDRIIHASAFRRLEYKTQVFVNHEGDYYRTRLTHTVEVAQISRTAARALRLNEDLTESIALSHDLGHGPFGHKGEHVLTDLMKDHGGFEHNAHGLRVVDFLERRYPRWPGLNLTYEVREAFALHSPKDTAALGFETGRRPLLEAQLVDVCDNLTYSAHDLDDGITSGILTPEALREADLWREHWDPTVAANPDLPRRQQVLATVKRVIDAGVSDLIGASMQRVEDAGVDTPDAVQAHGHLLIGFSEEMGRLQRRLAHFLHEHFYNHPRLMKMGQRARRFLTSLFDAYRAEPRMLTTEERQWAEEVGVERAVCDKIAAMTDREAQEEYVRLFEPFERM